MAQVVRRWSWAGPTCCLVLVAAACGGRQAQDGSGGGGHTAQGGSSSGSKSNGSAGSGGAGSGVGGHTEQGGASSGSGNAGRAGAETAGAGGKPPEHQPCEFDRPQCPAGQECHINPIGTYWCERCGGPGEGCCGSAVGQGASCRDGGCCVSYRCVADNEPCGPRKLGLCTAGKCTGCGEIGQACCGDVDSPACHGSSGVTCIDLPAGGGTDRASQCQHCGVPGEPCCAEGACGDGGCCNLRVTGGIPSTTCVAPGGLCLNGASCAQQSCGTCGGEGQPCCSISGDDVDAFCTAPSLNCSSRDGNPFACLR